ncbi:hypothetical protein NESM_000426000 [Novymonas esmeraldas]|uniref:Membrane-associated protein n=1 Tax=Novymonas esmeraldas TaxID=1808958 RepID=A0AAW0ELV4_9TRYP
MSRCASTAHRLQTRGHLSLRAVGPASTLATLVPVLLLLLVRAGGTPAAALAGTASCPVNATVATAWCNMYFGGSGGIVTAGEWQANSFACVCNGVASVTVTRQINTVSGSSHPPPPKPPMTSSAISPHPSLSSSSLSSLSSSSLSSEDSASSSSEHHKPSSSSSSSVVPSYTCQWAGVFSHYPDGLQCLPSTGVCPTTCSVMPPYLCEAQAAGGCSVAADGTLTYFCQTCTGRVYTINTTGPQSCQRSYTAPLCDPQKDCSRNGCCTVYRGESNSNATGGVCDCFSNNSHGFYTGATCAQCAASYTISSDGLCRLRAQPVQLLLASIAKTWTMVSPNVAVLLLFVIFSLVRKLNTSDRPFEMTSMRRANLSTVQVARRRQQSLFHSKYIPMRPAKSRSFANPHQPHTRGPPAY